MRRFQTSTWESYKDREDGIVSFLRENGETPIKAMCTWLGYSWPAELESVRLILNRMVHKGLLTKTIRPNHETRVAYYSITNPMAAWKEPGDFSPTRSASTGAVDQIGGVAPSPSDTSQVTSNHRGSD